MSGKSVYSSQESLDTIATSHDQNRLYHDSAQPDINVLLLGQTGFGKTTFINAFANHLVYESLASALKAEPVSVIHASFSLSDPVTYASKKIDFGQRDPNEKFHKAGQSSTQGCQSYVFVVGDRKLRLIDAPGIGDTRGPKQDATNFEHILDYISQYQYLNGICILLKPNEERLNTTFRYCFKELFTHLHRNAAENIMFVFTNGRSTHYMPGGTSPILRQLIDEIHNATQARIPFSKSNTFVLDNEGFRFLAADRKGMKFPRDQLDSHARSWEISAEQYTRLFSCISNSNPHEIQDTISINAAQQHIRKLTRPLAEVARLIAENVSLAEQFKGQSTKRIAQKSGRFVQLECPRTVCTSEKCTSVIMTDGQLRVDYRQHCHTECYLRKVDEEVISHPKLRRCQAMDKETGNAYCNEQNGWCYQAPLLHPPPSFYTCSLLCFFETGRGEKV